MSLGLWTGFDQLCGVEITGVDIQNIFFIVALVDGIMSGWLSWLERWSHILYE